MMIDPDRVTTGPSDAGVIVLGWLTKIVLSLALVGLIGFDLISVTVANFSAGERGSTAARAASAACQASKGDVQQAYDAAFAVALEYADTIDTKNFSCLPNGAVSLDYRHEAATLLMSKIGPLKKYSTATVTSEAAPAR